MTTLNPASPASGGGFRLDTSGSVSFRLHGLMQTKIWSDHDPFMQGYTEAALKALDDQRMAHYQAERRANRPCAVPMPAAYRWLAPETLARIIEDCAAILAAKPALYNQLYDGVMVWKNRQSGKCPAFPPQTPFLSNDGKVRLRADAIPAHGLRTNRGDV